MKKNNKKIIFKTKEDINSVTVNENGEPLKKIFQNDKIRLSKKVTDNFYARETVCNMLNEVAAVIPKKFTLIIVEAFRSFERQKELWDKQFFIVKKQNPNVTLNELKRMTRIFVAEPTKLGGGHQTGGAIDITLGDKDGKEIFMGTRVHQFCSKTRTMANGLNNKERKLRKELFEAMEKVGFKNYPAEWWHFSYGDRLWAAYSNKKECIYGPIKHLTKK